MFTRQMVRKQSHVPLTYTTLLMLIINLPQTEGTTLSDDQSLTSMYDNATLCDECFLSMLTERMNSSYLANSDFNNYLTVELEAALDYCGYDSSDISLNAFTSFSWSIGPSSTTTASASSTSAASAICTGQIVASSSSVARSDSKRQLLTGTSANTNISESCLEYSLEYNVPTGAIILSAGNSSCDSIPSGTCLPLECDLAQVQGDATTCSVLTSGLTVAGTSVSQVMFLAWNPAIIGICDSLQVGQYYCTR